jgi:enamine deaminase RidA (YjgF/YER057c/UK114 family)
MPKRTSNTLPPARTLRSYRPLADEATTVAGLARKSVYSGTPWEQSVAYCRAKRVGNIVVVSGTVAADEQGAVVAPGDAYEQARYALQKIMTALEELGASAADVVRTRTYLTDIGNFEAFARAHHEFFAGTDPTATCVEVSRLVSPGFLVEIEVDAVLL